MRGDSLRDLYAKVLAILGLGALAAAGAVVDYWPVSTEVPRVASVRRSLAPAAPAMARSASLVTPPAPGQAPSSIRRSQPQQSSQSVMTSPAQAEYVLSLSMHHGMPAGESVTLSAPVKSALTLAIADRAPAVEVGLTAAPVPATPADALPFGLSAPATDRANGVLTGALKKTGESLVKTGAATGASIVEAFRGVMGAFKKVSPFNDDAAMFRPAGL